MKEMEFLTVQRVEIPKMEIINLVLLEFFCIQTNACHLKAMGMLM